jgi:peptide/nickel transport system substrate-binding protein
MQIIDDYTVDIKTKTPDPLLLNQWAAWCRVISKKFFDENGSEGLQKQAIGTGPFKFVSWKRNDSLALEANTGWYMPSPKVKTLTFRMIPEMGARVAELQAGGAQIITAVPPFIVSQLKKSGDTDVQSVPSLRAFYMILDTTKVAPLKDKRVRQALNYAVDKEAIIKAVLVGMGTPLGTPTDLTASDTHTHTGTNRHAVRNCLSSSL